MKLPFNARHAANNAAGLFMVCVVFFVATIAINRAFPSGATGTLLWFFTLLGVAALAVWTFCSFQAAGDTGANLLFASRRPRR